MTREVGVVSAHQKNTMSSSIRYSTVIAAQLTSLVWVGRGSTTLHFYLQYCTITCVPDVWDRSCARVFVREGLGHSDATMALLSITSLTRMTVWCCEAASHSSAGQSSTDSGSLLYTSPICSTRETETGEAPR